MSDQELRRGIILFMHGGAETLPDEILEEIKDKIYRIEDNRWQQRKLDRFTELVGVRLAKKFLKGSYSSKEWITIPPGGPRRVRHIITNIMPGENNNVRLITRCSYIFEKSKKEARKLLREGIIKKKDASEIVRSYYGWCSKCF